MKYSAEFRGFVITPSRIDFTITEYVDEKVDYTSPLYMELTHPANPSERIIALAIAGFCGFKYSSIFFDLTLDDDTLSEIAKCTGARITAEKHTGIEKKDAAVRSGAVLNFSGGFDSLAAKCIMPDDTKLVSIDFGHWFAREEEYFRAFKPYTVKTNMRRDMKYDNSAWAFMSLASILYSDYLNATHIVFGSILEASVRNMNCEGIDKTPGYSQDYFKAAGYSQANYTEGITEVGTLMIILKYMPDQVAMSLKSLAQKNSIKYLRKWMLLKIVCKRMGMKMPEVDKPADNIKPMPFARDFADTFLILYIIKNASLNEAHRLFVNIPQSAIDIVRKYKLTFYERQNPEFIPRIPSEHRQSTIGKLRVAEIIPYDENDEREFMLVSHYLMYGYDFIEEQ